jgi:predicted signal transduction protein with EAL and GGDEF domain
MPSALAIADTIRKQVQKSRFVYDQQNFHIGVSIGVVEITDSDNNLGDIFKAADSAYYMAKERERNLVHAYSPTDEYVAERAREVLWVGRLHTALRRGFIYTACSTHYSTKHPRVFCRSLRTTTAPNRR